jgi:DNA polymerase I-like protein with 3'-5' exonuclease and polymerase domains
VLKAEEHNAIFKTELEKELETFPPKLDPWSGQSIAKWINSKFHLAVPHTQKGNESVTNDWLLSSGIDELKYLAHWRKKEKFRRDFIESVIIGENHKGRLHPQWFSARGSSFMNPNDANGTKSGRLSCTGPNLQQIPARHPVYGPMIRELFLPEDNEFYCSADYQAQEIRIGIHFAVALNLPGAKEIAQKYAENPTMDYHANTMEKINALGGFQATRFQSKTANLSIQYGIGKAKLGKNLEMKLAEITSFLEAFHQASPYLKPALNYAMRIANERGFVKTILGRRRHFNLWENAAYSNHNEWVRPLPKEEALARWGNIKRAGTYKAWNSVVQGTAAEMAKLSIVNVYKETGIVPLMTVHDELDLSIKNETEAKHIKNILENVLKLNIPIVVDMGIGTNWKEAHS